MYLTTNLSIKKHISPSHAAIKISINATAAEFICKNIFLTPVQIKKIIKSKIGDIQQIYLLFGRSRPNNTVISQMWQLPLHFQVAPNIFTII